MSWKNITAIIVAVIGLIGIGISSFSNMTIPLLQNKTISDYIFSQFQNKQENKTIEIPTNQNNVTESKVSNISIPLTVKEFQGCWMEPSLYQKVVSQNVAQDWVCKFFRQTKVSIVSIPSNTKKVKLKLGILDKVARNMDSEINYKVSINADGKDVIKEKVFDTSNRVFEDEFEVTKSLVITLSDTYPYINIANNDGLYIFEASAII